MNVIPNRSGKLREHQAGLMPLKTTPWLIILKLQKRKEKNKNNNSERQKSDLQSTRDESQLHLQTPCE